MWNVLVDRYSDLSEDQQQRMLAKLGNWLAQNPGSAAQLQDSVERLASEMSTEGREALQHVILNVDQRVASNPPLRRPILGLAARVGLTDRRERAYKMLIQRLESLEQSGQPVQSQLATEIRQEFGIDA
jgi:hypothetical protein